MCSLQSTSQLRRRSAHGNWGSVSLLCWKWRSIVSSLRQLSSCGLDAKTDSVAARTLSLVSMSWYLVLVCLIFQSTYWISANCFSSATALLGQFDTIWSIISNLHTDMRQQSFKFLHRSLDTLLSCSLLSAEDAVCLPLFLSLDETLTLHSLHLCRIHSTWW